MSEIAIYVFHVKRPSDREMHPCVYSKLNLAQKAPYRVSQVAKVTFRDDGERPFDVELLPD